MMPGAFTMRLHEVIELEGGAITVDPSTNISKVTGGTDFGLDHYPIFDENYRPTLNGMIIDHYFNREIGMESIPLFKMALRRKMNEIMPYYNKLYLSEQIQFDPLATINLSTVTTSERQGEAHGTIEQSADSLSDSKSRSVASDTPQQQLSGNGQYATSIADSNGDSSSTSETNTTNNANDSATGRDETTTSGYQSPAAELITLYRNQLLNISLAVIEAIADCFMSVWDNGDSFTKGYTYL